MSTKINQLWHQSYQGRISRLMSGRTERALALTSLKRSMGLPVQSLILGAIASGIIGG